MGLDLIEIDDHFFGNVYLTTLTIDGESIEFSGMRPNQAYGVFGLVEFDGLYHIMHEDDGHYWTSVILSNDELSKLRTRVSEIYDVVCSVKKWST